MESLEKLHIATHKHLEGQHVKAAVSVDINPANSWTFSILC